MTCIFCTQLITAFPFRIVMFYNVIECFYSLICRLYVVHCGTSWPRMGRKTHFWQNQIHELCRMQEEIWYCRIFCQIWRKSLPLHQKRVDFLLNVSQESGKKFEFEFSRQFAINLSDHYSFFRLCRTSGQPLQMPIVLLSSNLLPCEPEWSPFFKYYVLKSFKW